MNLTFGLGRDLAGSLKGWSMEKRDTEWSQRSRGGGFIKSEKKQMRV